ncbi:MAG: cob(I)yrinic acid a,c-diamide adenosyltransferase [Anaerolineales bacterium]|jgi:cob(I)alamin adenosyltransferase
MTKFYTRQGDDGFTSLLGEGRVPKDSPRLEAVGAIDEATAAIGIARANCQTAETIPLLLEVQRDLYNTMAEVAATPENAKKFRVTDASRVSWLEGKIEEIGSAIEMPKDFILPGDTSSGGYFALARTVVRRAERALVHLYHQGDIENESLIGYLNRLSSLCFLLELVENRLGGKSMPTLAKGKEANK